MKQISKQDTSQKDSCGKLDNQTGTLHTELTFPNIANWFRCFPRSLWNYKFHMWKSVTELQDNLVFAKKINDKRVKQFQILVCFYTIPTTVVSIHTESRTRRATQLMQEKTRALVLRGNAYILCLIKNYFYVAILSPVVMSIINSLLRCHKQQLGL